MILKMSEIINFNYFYEEVRAKKLPLKTLFKLSNLGKAIDSQTAFYREKIQEIFTEYGDLDEEGNVQYTEDGRGIKIKPGMEKECFDKISELQAIEVELPEVTFSLEEFGDAEMTLEVFNLITPFIVE